MISEAAVATPNASKYLQQLCKHWAHKFTVEFDPAAGRIDFGDGRRVDLSATPEALHVQVTTPDPAGIERLEQVVADHILRFAFREELAFAWQRGAA